MSRERTRPPNPAPTAATSTLCCHATTLWLGTPYNDTGILAAKTTYIGFTARAHCRRFSWVVMVGGIICEWYKEWILMTMGSTAVQIPAVGTVHKLSYLAV